MSRIRKKIEVEYDTSNAQHYIFVPVIHSWNPSEDQVRKETVWHSAFTSLGAAQKFFNHMADKEINRGMWVREHIEGSDIWTLYLKDENECGGYRVILEETLLIHK